MVARFEIAPANALARAGWVVGSVLMLVVLGALEEGLPLEGLLVVVAVGVLPLLAFVAMGRPRGSRVLEVLEDRLHLPFGPRSEQTIVVRYPELTSVYRRRGRRGYLLIATPYVQIKLDRTAFATSEDLDRAYGAIRGRLESFVPNGDAILERMDGANAAADEVADARPFVTIGLVVALLGTYAVMRAAGAFDRTYSIVGYGAGVTSLVEAGAFARVVTANWLHGTILHVAAVAFVVYQFGSRVERLFGSVDTLAVALVAALAGGVASAASATTPLFIGAQPMAFGLFGAYAFVATRYKANLPIGMRRPMTWWALIGFLLATLPLFSGAVDLPGELGGLLVGVVLSALVLVKDEAPLPQRRLKIPSALLALGGAATMAAVIVHFAWTADTEADETAMIRYHLDHSLGTRDRLNVIAWEIAIDPDADEERLALARTAIERALEREREEGVRAAYEDTYAQVLHRLGHRLEAIEHELESLRLSDRPFMATQVARFVGADAIVLRGAGDRDARLELVEHDKRGFGVRVVATTATTTSTLYAVARLDDRIVGLLRLSLDRTVDANVTRWLSKEGATASWPSGATLAPAVYAPGKSAWRAWSADPQALTLP